MMDGMSAVELPQEPQTATMQDLEALRALKQKHEKELREYEEETRRQRHNLRKMRRSLAEKQADAPAQETAEPPKQTDQQASKDAEAEKLEDEKFEKERAKLEQQLSNLQKERELIKERERQAAEAEAEARELVANAEDGSDQGESENSECDLGRPPRAAVVSTAVRAAVTSVQNRPGSESVGSFPTGEDSAAPSAAPSTAPSVAPSAVSSAAPSRSNSPTGSDAVARSAQLGAVTVEASAVSGAGKGSTAVAATPAGSAAATPRKGKGKGKGSAPPGPPPAPTPRGSIVQDKQERPPAKASKFVNLFWKTSQKPEEVDLENDQFLAKFYDLGPRDVPYDRSTLNVPDKVVVPARPATVWNREDVEVESFPEEMLEAYFRKSEVAVKLPQVDSNKQSKVAVGRTNLLDAKRLNMIGIMLQKHIMKHKEETNREAILNIKRGVLQCNFDVVKLECLSVIRTVLRQHVKDGSPLASYVRDHGDDAVWQLAYPEHHYLVHELSKVPQIDERLECMLFQQGFDENMTTSKQNLATLTKALQVLDARRHLIRRFFVTAHRLGQSLSQKPSRGFQLSTLEKLTLTKSTKLPHLSILHFVLALMSQDDARELFNEEDIVLLRNAKALGTAKVCDECRELAQGVYGVKQIYESGEYTCQSTGQAVKIERRRKTLPPCAAAAAKSGQHQEPVIDTDDRFHEVMQKFVEKRVDEADDIVVECHNMLLKYKELALFFDDLNNVYPPPKDPSDKKLDLVDVFYRFAKVVPHHRQQVEEENLRDVLGSTSS